jgi:Ca2+-binding EF-hand superfamily protein
MAAGGVMKAVIFLLAIQVVVSAEPVGLKEDTGANVIPEGKQVEALVDEVLMEVETNSHTNNNNNDNNNNAEKDTRGALRKKHEAEAIVAELDEGIDDLFTKISSDIPPINLWAFGGIITFLLSFTVLFENTKEKTVEKTRGSSQEPIVSSIFSELTVLGFLAMICFLITKFGLDHISLMVFGTSEGKEHEENKEKLGEMLESIHMVIFLVMVIFIFEALGMLQLAEAESERWCDMEGEILTLHQRLALVGKWKDMNEPDQKPGSWSLFFNITPAARTYNSTQAQVRFMLMRQEFINDEANANNALKRDFRFHMYLTKVMGERLGQMIELPWTQWVLLEVVIMIFLIVAATIAQGSWLFVLATWLCASWGLLIIAMLFYRGLYRAYTRINHSCDGMTMLESEDAKYYELKSAARLAQISAGSKLDPLEGSGKGAGSGAEDETAKEEEDEIAKVEATEEDALLESPEHPEEDEMVEEEKIDAEHPGGHRTWIQSRPRYLDDPSLDVGTWWVPESKREMPKTKNPDVIRFYNLFAFGKAEKRWHLFVIRFLFLSEALFLSVFCLNVLPLYVDEAYTWYEALFIAMIGIGPGMFVYFFYMYNILDLSVLVTSVEFFRLRRMVMAVVRHQKEDRAVMLLRIIVALHMSSPQSQQIDTVLARMQAVVEDPEAQHKGKINTLLEHDTSLELEHLADIFDNLDQDNSGSLSNKEVEQLLKQFGINPTTGSESAALRDSIKSWGHTDTGEEVAMSKAEFLTWMLNKAQQAEKLDAEEVAHFVFKKWDKDHQGHLSVEELLEGFSSLGEAFTTNEVSNLVLELDLNDDGEFDHEEFAIWVERHSKEREDENEWCCGLSALACLCCSDKKEEEE